MSLARSAHFPIVNPSRDTDEQTRCATLSLRCCLSARQTCSWDAWECSLIQRAAAASFYEMKRAGQALVGSQSPLKNNLVAEQRLIYTHTETHTLTYSHTLAALILLGQFSGDSLNNSSKPV